MRCEIAAVGTELLLGQIVDTNSAWIGEQLALAGIDSHFQTKVGDNLERIVQTIHLALERSDAVIVCGGLGPTQDDITREAIARVMDVPLVMRPEIGERIRAMFEARGRVMAANNLRQAEVPEGAAVIPEMPGTAPGLICPVGAKVIYAVPGVPHEMRTMVGATVIPDLQRRAGAPTVIRSRVLRTWGQSESGLAELLAGRIQELDLQGNPTLAFQASGIEGIKVRITAKAAEEATAFALIAAEEAWLRALIGDWVFGVDDETMEAVVLRLLQARGLSLGLVETITGGLMASRLTSTTGDEEALEGVLVVGTGATTMTLLRLEHTPGCDEADVASMAEAARRLFGADIGLAATGSSDPEPADGRIVGRVLLGLATGRRTLTREVRLPGDRRRIREYAVISLLDFLRRTLLTWQSD